MDNEKIKSVQAIELVRTVFESIHGNIGLLKFNIEELTPKNGKGEDDSQKWEIICSFYETLGSANPSRYSATVDLKDNTISIKKLDIGNSAKEERFIVKKQV